MKKAALIDLDGTLIDTMPRLYEAYCHFLRAWKIRGTVKEFKSLIGPSLPEVIKTLQQRYHLPNVDLVTFYEANIQKSLSKVSLFNGVREFIAFAQAHNIRLAVVTSSSEAYATRYLEYFEILHHFDYLVTADSVELSKPHPDLYLKALNLMNVTPYEAFAIEDSQAGVESATKAHLKTLWLSKSAHIKQSQIIVVENWHQILELVRQDKI